MCVRKPLLVTCSTDKSVRLWNYNDRTCELTKYFADEIFSVAIHPTGLQILVGFADKLRLMTVLMEDMKTVKELGIKVRVCPCVFGMCVCVCVWVYVGGWVCS